MKRFFYTIGSLLCMACFCLILDSGKYSNCNLGNCLRLFALQDVSAEAMRNVFDNLPGTFKEKLNAYSQYQSISEWKEMISGGYILNLNIIFCILFIENQNRLGNGQSIHKNPFENSKVQVVYEIMYRIL